MSLANNIVYMSLDTRLRGMEGGRRRWRGWRVWMEAEGMEGGGVRWRVWSEVR